MNLVVMNKFSGPRRLALAVICALFAQNLVKAEEITEIQPSADYAKLENFSVLGDAETARSVAGSAHFIEAAELETFAHSDVLRVLREVPGVYLQEEEGYGLRPNIGIRGSGLDRSSRITLLEDGVLISPAPYSAPAAYYFPGVQRMHAIEVVKGPAAIALGPRTTGGAINLLSTPVPDYFTGTLELRGGQEGLLQGLARVGSAGERFGWLLEANQQHTDGFKELDNGGDTGYHLQDYVGKVQLRSAPGSRWEQTLELKLGYWEQDGDESYVGLTDADFAFTPYRRYAGSQLDRFFGHHSQYQLNWTLAPADANWDLAVSAYRNDFHRNWYKLGKVGGISISSILSDPAGNAQELAWLRGDADSPDDALNLRNNNREYYSQGIQAILNSELRTDTATHHFEFGVRVHEDEEDRLQDEDLYSITAGTMTLTTDGAAGSQANRLSEAHAVALHLSDRIEFGRFSVTPGLRYENITLTRNDFDTADPQRVAGPTRVRENNFDVWVPGVGVTWQASDGILLIGGVNRGFNPPAPGSSAEAEESVNFEAGVRYYRAGVSVEAIGFVSDYRNLVGTCTASTGGNCAIGDQFDGGESTVRGIEVGGRYRIAGLGNSGLGVPLSLNYTWTPTADFDNSFSSSFEPWGDVQAGDRMPYVPTHQLQFGAGIEGASWSTQLLANYQDATRTVAGSGPIPDTESTDQRFIIDLAARWQLTDQLQLIGRVENLLDETYNVARRPAGVRPGMPRTAALGFRYDL